MNATMEKTELVREIQKAIEDDAGNARHRDEYKYLHSFGLKELKLSDQQLSEMLEKLDAGKRVRTKVAVTFIHRWTNGADSGAEELFDLHFLEVWRERAGKQDVIRVDARFSAYWELIPPGSPGYLSDYPDPQGLVISIAGLDPADVLAALYNASRPLGMGFLQYDPEAMSKGEANQLLKQARSFDYLKGRVMKVSFGSGWGLHFL